MKRFFHHVFARMFGYFWLPCKGCGQWFGGHEVARTFRKGHVSIACPAEDHQTGLLVCPDCCVEGDTKGPIPSQHLIYQSLYSGIVVKVDGDLVGMPPLNIPDYVFWGRMRMVAVSILPPILLLMLCGYTNPWANIGIMLSFVLTAICNRVSPPSAGHPIVLVILQSLNVLMIIVHLAVAWSRWRR